MAERPRVKDVVMRTTDQIGDINKKPLKVCDKLDGLMDGWMETSKVCTGDNIVFSVTTNC